MLFRSVSHTANTYSPYPETVAAAQMITNHLNVVESHPFATAYLIGQKSNYDPAALQVEMMAGLRTRQAPQDYLRSVQIAIGNDYYYNFLVPQFTKEYGQPTVVTLQNGQTVNIPGLSYEGSKLLAAAAKQFGNNLNPIWYDDHTGAVRKNNAKHSFEDMQSLLSNKSQWSQVLSPEQHNNFQQWVTGYQNVVNNITALRNEGDKAGAYQWENWWYATCTAAETEPQWSEQAYFIQSVLRKMPGL